MTVDEPIVEGTQTVEEPENKTKRGRSSRRKTEEVKMNSNDKHENPVNTELLDEPFKAPSEVEGKPKRGRSSSNKKDIDVRTEVVASEIDMDKEKVVVESSPVLEASSEAGGVLSVEGTSKLG